MSKKKRRHQKQAAPPPPSTVEKVADPRCAETVSDSENSETKPDPRKARPIEVWGFWVLVAYTIVTAGLWRMAIVTRKEERRAWVLCDSIHSDVIVTGQPLKFTVLYRNSGAGPALGVRGEARIRVSVDPPPPPTPNPEDKPSAATIGAGSVYPADLFVPVPISDADMAAIKSGARALYAVSFILYRDQFGDTHHSTCCWVYDRKPDGTGDYSFCPTGNEAN